MTPEYNGMPVMLSAPLMVMDETVDVKLENSWVQNGVKYAPLTFRNISRVLDTLPGIYVIPDELVRIDSYRYAIGSWDCLDSPWGVCVYDHKTDKPHDFCLVCGNPEERK